MCDICKLSPLEFANQFKTKAEREEAGKVITNHLPADKKKLSDYSTKK